MGRETRNDGVLQRYATLLMDSPRQAALQRYTEIMNPGQPHVEEHAGILQEPGKDTFLNVLRSRITEMAEAVLAPAGLSVSGCPYIPYWFNYYAGKDAAHLEAAILRYAPETGKASDWTEFLELLVDHVRGAFEQHVKNGSLEGVPDEIPKDLHETENPKAPLSTSSPVIQGCFGWCGDSGEPTPTETTKLIHEGVDSGFHTQSIDFYGEGTFPPDPGQKVNLKGWTENNSQIFGHYPVYFQIDSPHYRVIATTNPVSYSATVVANSYLTSKPRSSKTIYFTSFESNPPFSGLGRIALDKLEETTGLIAVPSGPIPGAYSAYAHLGMEGFYIPTGISSKVAKLSSEAREIKQTNFDIESDVDREKLRKKQKEIVKVEERGFMGSDPITYKEPII